MGVKLGKVWGETEELLANGQIQVHRALIHSGATCSKHMHAARYNAFYCLSGCVEIRVWRRGGSKAKSNADSIFLGVGDFTIVAPGELHQFEGHADEGSEILEIYYPAPVRADDIERFS